MEKEEILIKFLQGEGPLDGVWYGDKPANMGPFWWRKYLREYEFHKLASENKLLREENKHLISKYVNLDEINVTTYASHTKEELIKELNYYQNVVCAAKDNTNRMLLEEIERLKVVIKTKDQLLDSIQSDFKKLSDQGKLDV